MFDVPKIVEAALPEEKRNGRTIGIVGGSMAGAGPNHNDQNFLSDDFPKSKPKLYITAEEDEFDELTIAEWKNEGFDVEYFSLGNGGKEYQSHLRALANQDLGPCETFGIVAYGNAASQCLEYFHIPDNNRSMKLALLVCYYPTSIPDPRTKIPNVDVVVHLAEGDETINIIKQDQMVGIQGKKRTVRRQIPQGMGSGRYVKYNYPTYSYDADSGFAEQDMDAYDKISADLAWTRSLTAARRVWRRNINLERVHEENVQGIQILHQNLQKTMSTYTANTTPHVTFVPTLTGGIDADELHDFYGHYFLHRNPASLQLTLLSRTIGTNRIVDELHVAFKHTEEMPWILPGVAPTKKKVEVIIVSVVTVRGGKLAHERVYWDQASVLVQVGLLDPNLVPDKAKRRGLKKLPVVGREAAHRRLEGNEDEDIEDGEANNELIEDWVEEDEDEGEEQNEEEEGEGGSGQEEDGDEESEQGEDGHDEGDEIMVEQDKAHHSDEEPSRS
ncbi:hypothetical protein PG997_008228 [Apiospora hydei]|uniref:Dienelactone hydrolase n=1 Tax=Apiospora hydei TaxID=1337664 RepID=A0ABR1WA76_9PEZI